jgi:hypothetical protein
MPVGLHYIPFNARSVKIRSLFEISDSVILKAGSSCSSSLLTNIYPDRGVRSRGDGWAPEGIDALVWSLGTFVPLTLRFGVTLSVDIIGIVTFVTIITPGISVFTIIKTYTSISWICDILSGKAVVRAVKFAPVAVPLPFFIIICGAR